MARTLNEKNYMKFVSNQLNLPVFLASRNRIKSNLNPLRSYIGRKSLFYTKHCNQENATETATTKKYKHIIGLEQAPTAEFCPTRSILKQQLRDLDRKSPWILAPNRYKVGKQPFARRKGLGGASWRKLPTRQPLRKEVQPLHTTYYYASNKIGSCNRYKSVFMSNARIHRATARCMISDLSSCYRNPNDPAPNTYYPQNYTLVNNVSPPIITKPPNPHTFLPRSSVPAKETFINISNRFAHGPGRYETRYPNYCPCTWKLVVIPNLQLIIDREKRMKFRRRPFMKIKARYYCSPDWRHVPGQGFRHLFKIPLREISRRQKENRKSKETSKLDPRDAMKPDLKLYADARYIDMINDPNRPNLSIRKIPLKQPEPKIIFNCLKRYGRRGKIGTVNKKIAFQSGQDRFKAVERPTINITVSQLKKLTKSLPLERQLRDQPVMQKMPEEIKSKLMAVPKRLAVPENELKLRKRVFKFSPLPDIKMLVTANEVEKEIPKGIKYYNKTLDTCSFFKNEVLLTSMSQEEARFVGQNKIQ